MDSQGPIASLVDKAEAFGKTSYELYKLKAVGKSAELVSSVVASLPAIIAGVFFIFLLNTGISLWVGELLNNVYYGFFAVAAFYLIVALILFVFRKNLIKKPVSNSIIRSALN